MRRAPRLVFTIVFALAGTVAYATSFGLLNAGVSVMWIRYLLATTAAYLVFVALLVMLARRQRRLGVSPVSKQNWDLHGLDGLDFAGVDTPAAFLIGGAILIVLLLLLLLSNAPVVLTEIALDAAVAGAALRPIQRSMTDDWALALRRTVWSWLLVATIVASAAAAAQHACPGTQTLGEIFRECR